MFNNQKAGIISGTEHEGVETSGWYAAPVLSTNIYEERSLTLPVFVIDPVALLEGSIVLGIIVIHQVFEGALNEVIHVDVRQLRAVVVFWLSPKEIKIEIGKTG